MGTVTNTGPGTELSETVSLGAIGYGQAGAAPQDVLSSMTNQNDALPSIIATSAFVHGELSLDYSLGSLPITVFFDPTEVFGNITGGVPPDAGAIMDVNGQWQDDGSDGAGISFTMQPKQSVTYAVWIQFPDVLTNAAPTITQSQANDLTFTLNPTIETGGSGSADTVSGPQAADCNIVGHQLLPFARFPFSLCKKGGGQIGS